MLKTIHGAYTIGPMQHFDELEIRAPQAREAALMSALPAQIAHARKNAPGWARILAAVDPAEVKSRAALARLPLTRKSDLGELQKAMPPLGGLNATPVAELDRGARERPAAVDAERGVPGPRDAARAG